MQVSFVINAVKRFWWALVAGVVVITGLAAFLKFPTETQYQSTALLLLSPPSNSGYISTQSDRYATNEIEVLRSAALAKSVSEFLKGELPPPVLRSSTEVVLTPASDIVAITATASTPELAQSIAAGYSTVYLQQLDARVNQDQNVRLDELNTRIEDVQVQLDALSEEIQSRMQPFVDAAVQSGNQVPALAEVDPSLDSRRVILQNQYDTLLNAATDADLGSRLRVTSQIVQAADVDRTPIDDSPVKFLLAGVFGGLFVGVAGAVVLARSSRWVLDTSHAEELLGRSMFGRHPGVEDADAVLRHLGVPSAPLRAEHFLDRLCAQAESFAVPGQGLAVMVVGASSDSDCTTLVWGLSARLNAEGRDVVLIDADLTNPELTSAFGGRTQSLSALLRSFARSEAQDGKRVRRSSGGLRVAGVLDEADARALRNASAEQVPLAGSRFGDVVLINGGALLDAATTMRMARIVTVLIVAVPKRKMLIQELRDVAAQLDDCEGHVLVVEMPARRHATPLTVVEEEPVIADAG